MKVRAMLSLCGVVTALCLSPGSLLAQDDNGGGPGGPGGGPGGGFDPAQFQQLMMTQTRQTLAITNDDEWAVIQPMIQKVMDARREANSGGMMMRGGGPGGGMAMRAGGPGGQGGFGPQASDEQQALQKALDGNAAVPQIKDALAKYRAARKAKQDKLVAAQENLKKYLTVKQEAQAVLMGILQ